MLTIKQIIESKGFYRFYEPMGVSLISLDNYKLLNVEERNRDNGEKDLPKVLQHRLNIFANHLKVTYVDPYWSNSKFLKYTAWDGVDKDNQGWHTDMFEKYDIFFLFYYDDTFSETGGAVHFKWKENGKFETDVIQPKSGDLILVSNARGFWHRADSTHIRRRVVSFDFVIEDD
jgi:hypothetical protein